MVEPRRSREIARIEAHVAIIEARYYEDINDALIEGAVQVLGHAGATYDRYTVPGALELPAAVAVLADGRSHYDGFIVLGCVIRGETTHYEIVSNESARGLMELAVRRKLAIGNGIITVENEEQAWMRARLDDLDKGGAAAEACLAMVAIKHKAEPRT